MYKKRNDKRTSCHPAQKGWQFFLLKNFIKFVQFASCCFDHFFSRWLRRLIICLVPEQSGISLRHVQHTRAAQQSEKHLLWQRGTYCRSNKPALQDKLSTCVPPAFAPLSVVEEGQAHNTIFKLDVSFCHLFPASKRAWLQRFHTSKRTTFECLNEIASHSQQKANINVKVALSAPERISWIHKDHTKTNYPPQHQTLQNRKP